MRVDADTVSSELATQPSCSYLAVGYGVKQAGYRSESGEEPTSSGDRRRLQQCVAPGYLGGMIIATNATGSLCNGDSGAPLFHATREVFGVATYIERACSSGVRAAYAPVIENLDFLEAALARARGRTASRQASGS